MWLETKELGIRVTTVIHTYIELWHARCCSKYLTCIDLLNLLNLHVRPWLLFPVGGRKTKAQVSSHLPHAVRSLTTSSFVMIKK